MSDPMDKPPSDHGSDRYDYVEVISAPPGAEEKLLGVTWFERLIAEPCPDCRANVFMTWLGRVEVEEDRVNWDVTIAHDDGCPTLARIEKRR